MFKEKEFSNLKLIKLFDKDLYIVDRHQYVLPIWASKSIESNNQYGLVSIDYHPDTNPPFWQKAYFKAINENNGEDDDYIASICLDMVSKINRDNLDNVVKCSHDLNNDEHINTAMYFNYLNDYHMINCMDNHIYDKGKHYLVSKENFSSLSDDMFESLNFKIPNEKFILDIDLDYFLDINSFKEEEGKSLEIFKRLVRESEFITIARSIKYFNYLKRDDFTINECEAMLIDMIHNILSEK